MYAWIEGTCWPYHALDTDTVLKKAFSNKMSSVISNVLPNKRKVSPMVQYKVKQKVQGFLKELADNSDLISGSCWVPTARAETPNRG
ncbi:hypothetical protein AVEN_233742-1 [Araneus ventricosus]|uniref:Uncharacterized protein n=1 Tax=Araneus ventricosus TaxID=182803 RepID=A0A4Y2MI02_ARAVE|nr:hypothetical protein AVEN_233742-1 [Araneus ventricosus]